MFKLAAPIVCLGYCLTASAESLVPFGADVKAPPKQVVKPIDVKPQAIDCLSASNASAWNVENPAAGSTAKLFKLQQRDGKNALIVSAGELVPARTTVRIHL